MGWGLPAAMGVSLSRPGEKVVCVSGDGSFWMVAQDFETCVREGLPVVNVVSNNFAYGNTRDRQRVAHGARYLGVFYDNADLADFARLHGAHGERVTDPGQVEAAIVRAIESGQPAIVDIVQDRHAGLPPDLEPLPAH
jgi:acetolactate synthase-1/2/3 large subunit